MVVYLDKQGASVGVDGQKITVYKSKDLIDVFPLYQVESLFLFGQIQITAKALSVLLEQKLNVYFFTQTGSYRGNLQGKPYCNFDVRFHQYIAYADEEIRLKIAKALIKAKVKNQHRVQSRWAKTHEVILHKSALEKTVFARLEKVTSYSELMGIEGSQSRTHFSALSQVIDAEGFEFTKRSRRPPLDPTNSLLSFSYSLLSTEANVACLNTHLDCSVGFLHHSDGRYTDLLFDMVEPMRPLVDLWLLKLINKKIFVVSDFDFSENGVYLKQGCKSVLLSEWHEWLAKPVSAFDADMTPREIMYKQFENLISALKGQEQISDKLFYLVG